MYRNSFLNSKHVDFPCPECNGDGKVYDPDDPPDPIEGRKLCRIIRCEKCAGTGRDKKECIKKAKEEVVKYKKSIKDWIEDCKTVDEINKKLTLQEQRFVAAHQYLLYPECGRHQ